MKIIDRKIDEWIKPYTTIIGGGIKVDEDLRKTNITKYFLHLSIPNIYESYAIILHSFWINKKLKNDEIKLSLRDDEDLPEEDFERVNWKEFFSIYKEDFDIKNCYNVREKISKENEQYNNFLYPGEGLCDKEHILSLKEKVIQLYGDVYVNAYYTLLSTIDFSNDKFYLGRISEIEKLFDIENLRLSPSLIFPDDKSWILNSDYDLPFSFIGGEKKLIEKLLEENQDEIFSIDY